MASLAGGVRQSTRCLLRRGARDVVEARWPRGTSSAHAFCSTAAVHAILPSLDVQQAESSSAAQRRLQERQGEGRVWRTHANEKRFKFRTLCADAEELETLSLRKLARFLKHSLASVPNREEILLFAIRWMQTNMKEVKDDLNVDGVYLDEDERGLVNALQTSDPLPSVLKILGPVEHQIIGFATPLERILSHLLNTRIHRKHGMEEEEGERKISVLYSIARHAHRFGQYKILRSVTTLVEPYFYTNTDTSWTSLSQHSAEHAARTYSLAMSSYGHEGRWNLLWQERATLLNAAKAAGESALRQNDEQPHLLALKAALRGHSEHIPRWSRQGSPVVKRSATYDLSRRSATLHREMLQMGLVIDPRWASTMISGLARHASLATDNDKRFVLAGYQLPAIVEARQDFFRQLHRLAQPMQGNETFSFHVLNLEIEMATAMATNPLFVASISKDELLSHLNWLAKLGINLSKRLPIIDGGSAGWSEKRTAFWLQSLRISVLKTKYAIAQMYLISDDLEGAFHYLHDALSFLQTDKERPVDQSDTTKVGLQQLQRGYQYVRSVIINVLAKLCAAEELARNGAHRRYLITLMGHVQKSIELGVWDTIRDDLETKPADSSRKNRDVAHDLANVCTRALGALSPAQSRGRVVWEGATYKFLASDDVEKHFEDFKAFLLTFVNVRDAAKRREDEQQPKVIRSCRTAFKNMLDDEPMRTIRIIWSLTSTWAPEDRRVRSIALRTDREAAEKARVDSKAFCTDLQWVLERIVLDFDLAPRIWRLTLDALRRHLRHIPIASERMRALQIFRDVQQRAIEKEKKKSQDRCNKSSQRTSEN